MIRRFGPALSAALAVLLVATPALAHKIKVFATAEGAVISGYAYFSGGNRAMNVKVHAEGTDGSLAYDGTTDDQGQFSFSARRRIDHVISIDSGDGHVASFTVMAAELPDTLPAGNVPAAPAIPAPVPEPVAPSAASSVPASPSVSLDALRGEIRAIVDQSVAQHVRPLREQLDAYQEKVWWHDVLGGIGYILGVGGIALWLASQRESSRHPRGAPR